MTARAPIAIAALAFRAALLPVAGVAQTASVPSAVALYSAATLTAMARVNDDRHWTSDVVIGALIGHLSAKWVSKQMGPVRVMPGAVTVNLEF